MNSSPECQAQALMTLEGVSQTYRIGDRIIPILRNISLTLWRGKTCALLGASGSGKSTLLNILGLLDRPLSGRFQFAGQDMLTASVDELATIRNREIGFVFQSFNLLPLLTALDNVALPLTYRGMLRHEAHAYALDQMRRVGLAGHAAHRPGRPSNCCCGGEDGGGGEQFRQQFHGLLLTVGELVVFSDFWWSSLACCGLCSNSISIKLMGSLPLPSAWWVR